MVCYLEELVLMTCKTWMEVQCHLICTTAATMVLEKHWSSNKSIIAWKMFIQIYERFWVPLPSSLFIFPSCRLSVNVNEIQIYVVSTENNWSPTQVNLFYPLWAGSLLLPSTTCTHIFCCFFFFKLVLAKNLPFLTFSDYLV